ncbi:MAG: 3-deoxy-D-manno-octulosonic acid transferase [Candidatus Omnitrophica bacterium]|nr:3-deoxy-D-manno-octulosonic acid transferase [Candidatus Omnitrophota bacterium]
MIMIFFYNLLLLLFSPFLLFYFLIQSNFIPKRRGGLLRKFGFYTTDNAFENTVVVHCVSVGETLSAIPFITKISQIFNRNIVFTTTTKTGWDIANERLFEKVKKIEFFPFDFPFSVLSFFRKYAPICIVITETELWPNIIFFAKLKKIPVFIINGRISDRSFPKYKKFKWFFRIFLEHPFFMMQTETDKNRIIEIGALEEKVIVTGNIKYDFTDEKLEIDRKTFGFTDDDLVWIAGSTHDKEEEIVLKTYKKLKEYYKNLKLIIAPRHPERFELVGNLVKNYGLKCVLRTENKSVEEVMILNTIGELRTFYSLCDVAFVGGSLANIGGHNIIEPAVFEKPILFGPYMQNFKDISEDFLKNCAAFQIDENTIFSTMYNLLKDKDLRKEMGKVAKEIILLNSGSLKKTINFIMDRLNVGNETF